MEKEEKVSVDTDVIQEPKIKSSEDAFDDFTKRNTDEALEKLHLDNQKEEQWQARWDFRLFRLGFKTVVLLIALWFIISSILTLNNLFSLISHEDGAAFLRNWHLPVVIIISFVSAIVAMFAILLRGLSKHVKSSSIEDIPLPALARVLVELSQTISSRNH